MTKLELKAKRKQFVDLKATTYFKYWRIIQLRKQENKCKICGVNMITPRSNVVITSNNLATVDHIVPLVRGGTNEYKNLQVICALCNSSKESPQTEDTWFNKTVRLLRSWGARDVFYDQSNYIAKEE